ncbi:MAG: SCO family protein [Acidimicrobiales bacterium]|nr:SCO family protein [Acidimicrobiales bacterium]
MFVVSCGGTARQNGSIGGSSTTATEAANRLSGIVRQQPLDVFDVSVTDARTGQTMPVAPPAGELRLVYFGYTSCPDVCPTTLADVRRALRTLPADESGKVSLLFVSVDPERDTAEILDGYVSSFVTPNYLVRLEDPDALAQLESRFGARSELGPRHEDGSYEVAHTALLYAVDPAGKVVVEWPFGTPSDAIASDLKILFSQLT